MSHLQPQVAIQVNRASRISTSRSSRTRNPSSESPPSPGSRSEPSSAGSRTELDGEVDVRRRPGSGADRRSADLCHAGGLTECKKIAGMAESHYAKIAMHTPNSIVQLAACFSSTPPARTSWLCEREPRLTRAGAGTPSSSAPAHLKEPARARRVRLCRGSRSSWLPASSSTKTGSPRS